MRGRLRVRRKSCMGENAPARAQLLAHARCPALAPKLAPWRNRTAHAPKFAQALELRMR